MRSSVSEVFTAQPVNQNNHCASNADECQRVIDTADAMETTHQNVSEATVGWCDDG